MRYFKHIALFMLVLMTACTGSRPLEPEPEPFIPSGAKGTKFTIDGVEFCERQTFGLFICCHEDQSQNPTGLQFEEHNLGYNNIRVTKTSESWTFYNSVIREELPQLYISTNTDKTNADVYAYAPYIEDAVSPTEIPFNINLNQDLMYVTENASQTENKDMLPSSVESNLHLHFEHVLAKLSFNCKIKNTMTSISTHTVDSIIIRKAGGKTTPLCVTGTFNAMTGQLTPLTYGDSIVARSIKYSASGGNGGSFKSTTPTSFNVMLYPQELAADGDLEAILVIDGFRKILPITRSNVEHSGGTQYGFRAGYNYNFNITIDNYVHLDGVTVKSDWTPGEYADEI